jgi:tetrahydrodipicolinate N-succinyltransferase
MYTKVQAREDDCLLGRNSMPRTGIIVEDVSGKTYKTTVTVL